MKIALFGGTFDPVHLGHLAVARAAAEKFDLGARCTLRRLICRRTSRSVSSRISSIALPCWRWPRPTIQRFVPSLLDAHTGQPNYSIDTVRRLKSTLRKTDKLYFLIGMDAFKDISTWRQPEELLAKSSSSWSAARAIRWQMSGGRCPQSLRPTDLMLRAMRHRKPKGPSR